ncbi:MAG: O-antigen ligase family protein [Acidobacteriota bacterium]|nr:MAG: O-antigen ligase family protein [Acidobacteriota bacterium]
MTGVAPPGRDERCISLAGALLAVAAGLALGLPPEVHPESGPLIALLLAGAAAVSPLRAVPLAVALLVVGLQLAVTLAPGRTIETLSRLALAGGALLVGRGLTARERRWLCASLVAVGSGLGLLAAAQKLWILPQAALIARATAAAEIAVRLEQNRPFGTHVVPAALGGGLVLSLAALAALWHRQAAKKWLALAAVPIAGGLLLTGSLGALLGLSAAALALVAGRLSRASRQESITGLALALVFVLVIGAIALGLRPVPVLDFSRADNPLLLRAGNWRGAVLVALRSPVVGTGLGSYGALYPAVRRAGDSQTIYAHNSWLQLAVEGGVPAAVLLLAAGWALWRRRRTATGHAERFLLAGLVGFAVHNLVDFTAYLPGVAVPALAIAGSLFPVPRASESSASEARSQWAGRGLAVAGLIAAGALWGGEMMARRALERAVANEPTPEHRPAISLLASSAARWAPWSPVVGTRAAGILAAEPARRAEAAAVAWRLARIDRESPAPWRVLGDLALVDGRPIDGWRHYRSASSRHPVDERLAAKLSRIEASLERAGLGQQPMDYGGQPHEASQRSWERWDSVVLLLHLVALTLVLARAARGGSATASSGAAAALGFAVLLVVWGEGGALPGARLGRQLLLAAAGLLLLWPFATSRGSPLRLPRTPLLALTPAVLWAALCSAVAPDASGARDGLLALIGGLAALVCSWELSSRHDRWPRLLTDLLAAGATLAAMLYLFQRLALMAGLGLGDWPAPLGVSSPRPASDFLHPGHLGTYLVAAGIALAGTALGRASGRRWRLGLAAALVVTGLLGGARATLALGLPAGLLLLGLRLDDRRLRRAVLAFLGAGIAIGATAMLLRFSAGDPYAFYRPRIWSASLQAWLSRPLFGFGPGGFASLAPRFAFADPLGAVAYGRVFRGPHSDLLAVLLGLGWPGACALVVGLSVPVRRAWAASRGRPELAAALAAAATLAAHGTVDEFVTARPAAALAAALMLGAVAGCGRPRAACWEPRALGRSASLIGVVVALTAGELLPWAADERLRAGAPAAAVALDPLRDDAWLALAAGSQGPPLARLARGLERTRRASNAQPAGWRPWVERARLLEAACRGPLQESQTCQQARAGWGAALARLPRDVLARRARAWLWHDTGGPSEAIADLLIALDVEPNFLGARVDLAWLLLETGQSERAREQLDTLMARAGAMPQVAAASDYELALRRVSRSRVEALMERLSSATGGRQDDTPASAPRPSSLRGTSGGALDESPARF